MGVVVTERKAAPASARRAAQAAAAVGWRQVERSKESLSQLRQKYGVDEILICKQNHSVLSTSSGELFFHLNMAQLRTKNIRLGKGDRLGEVMGLRGGETVLDCTLGLGADAIVCSYLVGESGRVVAVEKSPVIAYIVQEGLSEYKAGSERLTAALRQIEVLNADYKDYLKRQPANSFDIVYFDPMFTKPIMESQALMGLRAVADNSVLDRDSVAEALRVCKKMVVLKNNAASPLFQELGFTMATSGKYSKVKYGYILKGSS